ncbi:MAG: patatin-like phospholipase family protein [Candidatus Obscuribacter sp.]|nr:patatin-like phospholipase family protein [Candidatus Obscuribacter sp.]
MANPGTAPKIEMRKRRSHYFAGTLSCGFSLSCLLTLTQAQAYALSPEAPAQTDSIVKTSAGDRTEAKLFRPYTTKNASETTESEKPRSKRPKLGLALGGGGARGAAEIGVLKVLMAEGIKFDCVTGTSVGSVIGGFYCMGASAEDMERVFVRGDVMKHFMTVPLTFRIIVAPVMLIPRLFGCQEYDGLYKGNLFRKFLLRNMDMHVRNIEDLPIPFAAVALNLIDGRPYMLRKGNLGYAMQASSAVPALRKPVEIDGKLFADGGVVCNLPVKQCRELGADIVIAVNIDEPFEAKPLHHFRRIGSVSKRLLDWALFDIDEPQAQLADITIHPNTAGISLISTRRKDAVRGVKAGEEAARELLPQIRALLKEAGISYGTTVDGTNAGASNSSGSNSGGSNSEPAESN